jgi:hypothetical protein
MTRRDEATGASRQSVFEGLGVEALGDFAERSLRAWGLKRPSLAPADP